MTNPSDLLPRYRDLQTYVGWSDVDAARLHEIHAFIQPQFAPIIDDFYQVIGQHAEAAKVVTGGIEQVERLKGTLRDWLDDLFRGPYDDQFVLRRYRVGARHVEIGLAPYYANVALARIRQSLIAAVWQQASKMQSAAVNVIESINRVLDLDLAVIEYAYHLEFTAREQRQARLATLGKVAGGIAHELRNPLNAIKTSAYFLLNARQLTPEKQREHLERIDRQVNVSDRVITALSDFARLPAPELRPIAITELVRLAMDAISFSTDIQIAISIPEALPKISVDASQIAIVISNLIRNACDAMPQGGRLEISAQSDKFRVEGNMVPATGIIVSDSGCGMSEEILKHITEPLFSTKSRGLGLGLALAQDIVRKHGGQLLVKSQPGVGSTFTIMIPVRSPQH